MGEDDGDDGDDGEQKTPGMSGTSIDGDELPENLCKLSELFPDISLKHILHILRISNDDFDSAFEQLLSYDLIKADLERLDQKESETPIDPIEPPKEWVIIDNDKSCDDSERKKKKQNQKQKQKQKQQQREGNRRCSNVSTDSGHSIGVSGRRASSTLSSTSSSKNNNMSVGYNTPSTSLSDAMESLHIKEMAKNLEVQDEIMDILEIKEEQRDLVDWYLTQNSYKKLNTVYDIMLNFNPHESSSNQTRDKIETVPLNVLCSPDILTSGKSKSSFLMSDLIKNGVTTKNKVRQDDNEWNELQALIDDNPELDLPKKFYLLAMNWFHKDLGKILNAAILLNNCFENRPKIKNGQKVINTTLGHTAYDIEADEFFKVNKTGKIDKSGFECYDDYDGYELATDMSSASSASNLDSLKWRADKLKQTRNATSNKHLKSYYTTSIAETKSDIRNYHDMTQNKELLKKIDHAKRTFQIDCHNLSVQNALLALQICLDYWWNEEMHLRNVHSTRFEFTNATHVEPFVIITGRGLHSGGGIPKIKNATLKYLQDNDYKFSEDMSTVRVLGKRKVFK